ncbi:hypothetical protein H310_10923 [Aphanomyces invadans]|uniref:Uncharacterized protein n=1 Tax=Aphanomyces invadans TaxID=157072 RepID=A0A024TP43_9STRA|nr:hypothetical protein H310_10923 [Aphanomyces invadans]ETV95885.1 hypothetical protein H310_10923 [Aphanomyces invadans]|eukprot:XP_008875636.1 hypothetical protein H310_10923 [Aphanomyces invadans]
MNSAGVTFVSKRNPFTPDSPKSLIYYGLGRVRDIDMLVHHVTESLDVFVQENLVVLNMLLQILQHGDGVENHLNGL